MWLYSNIFKYFIIHDVEYSSRILTKEIREIEREGERRERERDGER